MKDTRKFTRYRLTDSMLQRLSAVCAGRRPQHGTAMLALKERGLVEEKLVQNSPRIFATEAGYKALEQARRDGW